MLSLLATVRDQSLASLLEPGLASGADRVTPAGMLVVLRDVADGLVEAGPLNSRLTGSSVRQDLGVAYRFELQPLRLDV